MENKRKLLVLRILAYAGVIILGASIILIAFTNNIMYYAGTIAGTFLLIFAIITSRLSVKKQSDERYRTIQEKAAYITLMVLFLAGPIMICGMLWIGEFFTIDMLVKASNILTYPLIILVIIYYVSVFYFKKKFGD